MNLNILFESKDVVWLRDGNEKLMGYESLEYLKKELRGAIEVDNLNVKLLDEKKLTEKILFI